MATDDQQVLVTGQASAPAHFRVPGNGQLRPKAVFASFDGTGAAVAFLPALKVISDGGETVGVYPTASSVAAGASADVSWFCRVGGAAATTPASTSVAITYAGGGPQTTPAGTHAWASFGTPSISDATVFSWTTTVNPNDTLVVAPAGVLLCIGSALWNVGLATSNVYVDSASAGIFRHTGFLTPQIGDGQQPPEGFSSLMDQCWINLSASNTHVHFAFSNGSGIASGPTNIQFAALMFVGAEA